MNTRVEQLNLSSELHVPNDGPVLLRFNNGPWTDVTHAFTTRRSTRADLEEPDMKSHPDANEDRVAESQNAVLASGLLPNRPIVRPEQVHGGDVQWVEPDPVQAEDRTPSVIPDVDGVLTRSTQVVLMAHSADCPIVFLYSDAGDGVAGLLHASWKGISHGIPRTGVRTILDETSLEPDDLNAAISPSIRACCYEVRENFRAAMLEREPITRPCVQEHDDQMFFDLQEAIQRQLEDAGLNNRQIVDAGLCSHCRNDLFYSYRRNGISTGRTAGLLSLYGTD